MHYEFLDGCRGWPPVAPAARSLTRSREGTSKESRGHDVKESRRSRNLNHHSSADFASKNVTCELCNVIDAVRMRNGGKLGAIEVLS